MAYTTFSGPVRSIAGFATPVKYITAADEAISSDINIDAGSNYVILATAQGGPVAAVNLILPLVTSGTFAPGSYPSDSNFDGLRGSVYNQSATLVHKLKGAASQPVNENAGGVNIAVNSVVQWAGNGNQSAPWLAVANALAANA
jgi:hypothetical protein